MKVRFTLEALAHIDGIRIYIEGHSPQAASHVVDRICAEAYRLGEFTQLGHVGIVPGTYEWIVPRLPFIIVHELNDNTDEVVVLAVFRCRQAR